MARAGTVSMADPGADGTPRRRFAALLDVRRLLRYAVAGGLSAVTHVGTLTVLVEFGGAAPVVASTAGFLLSIVVSYTLQRGWVFGATAPNRRTLPRFLAVTVVALGLNAAVLFVGTDVIGWHYAPVQIVALILIPISNYVINSLWTFRDVR